MLYGENRGDQIRGGRPNPIADLVRGDQLHGDIGVTLFEDFEEAFDTINHNFIMWALSFFKFGNDLLRWIEVFYKDISSRIINNGHAHLSGVWQGCPLSPNLFIIYIELLAISIRNAPLIKSIPISNSGRNKECCGLSDRPGL